jgi:hypothetical protein
MGALKAVKFQRVAQEKLLAEMYRQRQRFGDCLASLLLSPYPIPCTPYPYLREKFSAIPGAFANGFFLSLSEQKRNKI